MTTQTLPTVKNYLDRELLAQKAASSNFWVIVAENRICFFVADKHNKTTIGLTVIESADSFFQKGLFELRSLIEPLEISKYEYSNSHIVFETPLFTIAPNALFTIGKAELFLESVHPIPKFYTVKTDRLENHELVTIYAVPEIFCSTLKVIFPLATLHHYTSFLIPSVSKLQYQSHLFVQVHREYIDMIIWQKNSLRFANTFTYEADTDIIYFILSVAEQQKIQNESLEILLAGDLSITGTLLPLLKKYIPNVDIFKRSSDYSYPASFKEFQDQQYFTTSSILLCE